MHLGAVLEGLLPTSRTRLPRNSLGSPALLVTRKLTFEEIFVFLSEKPLNLTLREVVSYEPWIVTTEAEERARCARRASRRASGRSES